MKRYAYAVVALVLAFAASSLFLQNQVVESTANLVELSEPQASTLTNWPALLEALDRHEQDLQAALEVLDGDVYVGSITRQAVATCRRLGDRVWIPAWNNKAQANCDTVRANMVESHRRLFQAQAQYVFSTQCLGVTGGTVKPYDLYEGFEPQVRMMLEPIMADVKASATKKTCAEPTSAL